MKPKKIIIIGSTGSIGEQTLNFIYNNEFFDLYNIVGLSTKTQDALLERQCEYFQVKNAHVFEKKKAEIFQKANPKLKTYSGKEGLTQIIEDLDFDILVNAVSGTAGIEPTLTAIKKGKDVALANKESLVSKGIEIMKICKKTGARILPIDSEHSAIWQCLRGENKKEIKKIILTCSGGPFRNGIKWPLEKLAKIKPQEALNHPNWTMGKKISIDSATLMNKALEIIEAARLFEIDPDKIEVVIHPQSMIHSAVQFQDGLIKTQMGTADMRPIIAFALSHPERFKLPFPELELLEIKEGLTFEKVDSERFPSIAFARRALKLGEDMCAKLNQANEEAVEDFLAKKIGFLDIFEHIKKIF